MRWLLDFGASPAVLDTQRLGIPGVYEIAGQPEFSALVRQLKADRASAGEAMAAATPLLPC